MRTPLTLLAVFLASALLAACAPGATPQLIGSWPQASVPPVAPPLPQPAPPLNLYVVYNASLTLSVEDIWSARWDIRQVAQDLGGVVLSERSLETNPAASSYEIILAVPSNQLEVALSRLRRLGTVSDEVKTGEVRVGAPVGVNPAGSYSSLTVTLRQNWWVEVFRGLGRLFTLAVILTPFALMIVGLVTVLRAVGRWLNRQARSTGQEPPAG
jgi:hypothetical protein